MRNRTSFALAVAGLSAAAMIAMPVWAASGKDKLMHMTMHMTMHMAGMPSIPPRTMNHTFCMPSGKFDPEAMRGVISRDSKGQCKIEHYARHGNEISYDMMCKAPESLTSHAVVHLSGPDDFSGKSHTTVNAEGHQMTMDATYTAKRVGSCTYTPPSSD